MNESTYTASSFLCRGQLFIIVSSTVRRQYPRVGKLYPHGSHTGTLTCCRKTHLRKAQWNKTALSFKNKKSRSTRRRGKIVQCKKKKRQISTKCSLGLNWGHQDDCKKWCSTFTEKKTFKVICVTKNNTSSLLHFTGALLERFYEWQVFEIHVRSHCRESKHWQDDVSLQDTMSRSMLRITYQYTCNSSQLRARVNEEMQHVRSRSVSSSSIAS